MSCQRGGWFLWGLGRLAMRHRCLAWVALQSSRRFNEMQTQKLPLSSFSLVQGAVCCRHNDLKQRQRNLPSVMGRKQYSGKNSHVTALPARTHGLTCRPGSLPAPLPPEPGPCPSLPAETQSSHGRVKGALLRVSLTNSFLETKPPHFARRPMSAKIHEVNKSFLWPR